MNNMAYLLAGVFATALATTANGESRQLGAHQHGTGALNIAIEGNTVEMELIVPGADVAGFEHAPATDAEKKRLEEARALLGEAANVVEMAAAGGCKAGTSEVSITGAAAKSGKAEHHGHHEAEHGKDHDHGHHGDHHSAHHGDDGSHTEFTARYSFTCAEPNALSTMTFPYFEQFKNAEALNVLLVTAGGQSSFKVTRGSPSISLDGRL